MVVTVTPVDRRAVALQRATEIVIARQADGVSLAARTDFRFCAHQDLVGSPGPFGRIWHVAGRSGLQLLLETGITVDPPGPGHSAASARDQVWTVAQSDAERCVYVIELDDVEQPRTTRLPCVYVGQSVYSGPTRFAQHLQGYRSSRVVRRHGRLLRPELSARVPCTLDWQLALRREAQLAVELRDAGYCVHGGH